MRLRFGTVLAAALCGVVAAEAGNGREMWDIYTDFGLFEGAVRKTEKGFAADENGIRVETEVETGVAGVTRRRTVVRNLSEKPLVATCLLDSFRFEGGDFEVYTQANTWMNESRGAWQPLHTGVEARGGGMRTAYGAAPMLALWNAQTQRGRVFHLMSDAMWEMRATMMPGGGEKAHVVVQVGMNSRHLRYELKKGESVALPEVVSYDFTNKTDLDCHKLHAWWNATWPGSRNPSLYNTWLCRFDKLDYDFVMKQVKRAGELGLEYFVIDAGWFGPKGDWGSTRGDWKERPDGWLGGRLADISKAVRASGMKFGLWIEAETAAGNSEVMQKHPEYFCVQHGAKFLDFTRADARGHLRRLRQGLRGLQRRLPPVPARGAHAPPRHLPRRMRERRPDDGPRLGARLRQLLAQRQPEPDLRTAHREGDDAASAAAQDRALDHGAERNRPAAQLLGA